MSPARETTTKLLHQSEGLCQNLKCLIKSVWFCWKLILKGTREKKSFDNIRMSRFIWFNDIAVIFQFKPTFHFTLANVIFCAVTHCDRTLDRLQNGKS